MNRQAIITILIVTVGFGGIFILSSYLEGNRVDLTESYADSDLELQGKKLKGFALGAEGLLADWYWMRSLQYIGGKISSRGLENLNLEDMASMNPRLLYPLLDNATTLDPKLTAAHSYGATVLPAIDPDQAVTLTEKGIRDNPDQWRLLQHLGYIHWKLKNYEKAAEAYDRGAKISGSPPFFKLMAAKMRADSGSRDTARAIYAQMYAEAPDKQTKLTAELRLQQMQALDELDVVNPVLRQFRDRNGRCVSGFGEVLTALRQASISSGVDLRTDDSRNLVDPSGVAYRINTERCVAEIDSPTSKILPN